MEQLFYLAGLVSGDGRIENGRNRIDIRVADQEFAKLIAAEFHEYLPSLDFKNKRLRITSRYLVEELTINFGIPKGNKSKTVVIPNRVLDSTLPEYSACVAGWFDAEGSISFRKRKTRPAYPQISFCVCNKNICNGMKILLEKLELKTGQVFSSTLGRYVLKINGWKEIQKFFK